MWPLVADGLIVAATRAVVTLGDGDARKYGWVLLWCAAVVSIAGNAAHLLLPPGPVHPVVATAVAVVPHLTIVRARACAGEEVARAGDETETVLESNDDAPPTHATPQLTAEGLSNCRIADEIGKSEATVRKWLAAPVAS